MTKIFHLLLPLALMIGIASCSDTTEEVVEVAAYEGPIMELKDIMFYFSDSAVVQVKGTSPHRMEMGDGNQEYPKGLYLEFYDKQGKLESTIKANKATYNKEEDRWFGQQGVEVVNIESGKQLNTEELYWLPKDERIHTDKFVTIRGEDNVLYGTGLEAKQDFSSYSIMNVKGDLLLEEANQ